MESLFEDCDVLGSWIHFEGVWVKRSRESAGMEGKVSRDLVCWVM